MLPSADWLSQLFALMPVSGTLDIRCSFGAPWALPHNAVAKGEIPYHIVLKGEAVLDDWAGSGNTRLTAGDILLLPGGGEHYLHDGSGHRAKPVVRRYGTNVVINENSGTGEPFDMLCGSFFLASPYDRVLLRYLPERLIVRAGIETESRANSATGSRLANLVALMRAEADGECLGGGAMLNAYSAALFTLALRLASETETAPMGLLALAGHPRLAPALGAMLDDPARPWTLPELADICNMSRATLVRHFQERLGHSANDFLLDIRMTLAAKELGKSNISTGAVADLAGYQSEAAFQRAFKKYMGVTPSQWRRDSAVRAVRTNGLPA